MECAAEEPRFREVIEDQTACDATVRLIAADPFKAVLLRTALQDAGAQFDALGERTHLACSSRHPADVQSIGSANE